MNVCFQLGDQIRNQLDPLFTETKKVRASKIEDLYSEDISNTSKCFNSLYTKDSIASLVKFSYCINKLVCENLYTQWQKVTNKKFLFLINNF